VEPGDAVEDVQGPGPSFRWTDDDAPAGGDRTGGGREEPETQAGSNDQRITAVQQVGADLGRRMTAEDFAGPVVEFIGDAVRVGLAGFAEVGALGQVPPQEAVGVLVGPSLSGLRGLQKQTGTPVAEAKSRCSAISGPRSQVRERRSCGGKPRTER